MDDIPTGDVDDPGAETAANGKKTRLEEPCLLHGPDADAAAMGIISTCQAPCHEADETDLVPANANFGHLFPSADGMGRVTQARQIFPVSI